MKGNRKRVRDGKLKEKYPEVKSDFYLDIYDKTILNLIKTIFP